MAAIVNDRNLMLHNATVRKVVTNGVAVVATPSSSNFYVHADGSHGPDYVRITVTTIQCDGPFSFSIQGAKLTNITSTTADIAVADMTSMLAIVTVTAANAGAPVVGSCIVGMIADGLPGKAGTRGAGAYYAQGSAWSDAAAEAATPGDSQINDVVTISNGSTYALTKRWDGTAWSPLGGVYDGSLFVTGSINGASIKAGTLTLYNLDGSVALTAGGQLNPVNAAPGTLNSGVSLSSTGALQGAGGGQVQTLPVVDGARTVNYAPRDYGVVHVKEFKQCSSIGLSTASTYCTLETMKPWSDSSGGYATQWAYISASEVWKRSAGCGDAAWGAWVRDLDRSLYTGDLNATHGADWNSTVTNRPSDDAIKNNLIDLSFWYRRSSGFPWNLNQEGNAIFPCAPSGTSDLPFAAYGALPGPKGGAILCGTARNKRATVDLVAAGMPRSSP